MDLSAEREISPGDLYRILYTRAFDPQSGTLTMEFPVNEWRPHVTWLRSVLEKNIEKARKGDALPRTVNAYPRPIRTESDMSCMTKAHEQLTKLDQDATISYGDFWKGMAQGLNALDGCVYFGRTEIDGPKGTFFEQFEITFRRGGFVLPIRENPTPPVDFFLMGWEALAFPVALTDRVMPADGLDRTPFGFANHDVTHAFYQSEKMRHLNEMTINDGGLLERPLSALNWEERTRPDVRRPFADPSLAQRNILAWSARYATFEHGLQSKFPDERRKKIKNFLFWMCHEHYIPFPELEHWFAGGRTLVSQKSELRKRMRLLGESETEQDETLRVLHELSQNALKQPQ